jgi:hypothetical protein
MCNSSGHGDDLTTGVDDTFYGFLIIDENRNGAERMGLFSDR